MKIINPSLQSHLDSGATTMSLCWKLTRKDGVVFGFTDHDRKLVVDGQVYEASSGFTSSEIRQSLGLSVDNLNLSGGLSSASINEIDLNSGKYDDADLVLLWVNWSDTTQFVVLISGNLGEVKRSSSFFEAEFRSLSSRLNQTTGRTYQRHCDAILGDSKCKVNLSSFTYSSSILSIDNTRIFNCGLTTLSLDFLANGKITFTSGVLNGLSFEVKRQSGGKIELWTSPPFNFSVGNAFSISAGCDKSGKTCKTKFNNLINFQGFPLIPGNDKYSTYATTGITQMDGTSLFPDWLK
jgi:uncharacterized phage protein (TIGR02218 family)